MWANLEKQELRESIFILLDRIIKLEEILETILAQYLYFTNKGTS